MAGICLSASLSLLLRLNLCFWISVNLKAFGIPPPYFPVKQQYYILYPSVHILDMVYEKCLITQCTMLIWYIKSISYLPITHVVCKKSRMGFIDFGSKSNILTWKWTINGFNPFLLVRKCNIAYEKVRHHGMKIIVFGKTFEISVSCSILELSVVPIDDANSISFTVWQITWQITSHPVLHKIIDQFISA